LGRRGSRISRFAVACLASGLCGGCFATVAAARAHPVFVADNAGRIEKVTQRGAVSVVSDDPKLGQPGGITIGKGDKLLVSDFSGGSHAILRVNPGNGNVGTVSDSGKLDSPFDLAQSRKGQIYVADANAGPGGSGAVFRVDSGSGRAKTIAEGPPLVNPYGIALGGHHTLYLADDREDKGGAIFKVNTKTGAVRTLAKGAPLVDPTGLERGPGGKLYVTDYSAGPQSTGAVFRVSTKSGDVHLIRQGPPLDEMYGIDFDSNGTMWFPASPDTDDDHDVWKMKTSGSGLHGFVSSDFGAPYGVAVGD
jgi:sugar lactone lactonase YvrE